MYTTHTFTLSYTHVSVTDLPMYYTDTMINRLKQDLIKKIGTHMYTQIVSCTQERRGFHASHGCV